MELYGNCPTCGQQILSGACGCGITIRAEGGLTVFGDQPPTIYPQNPEVESLRRQLAAAESARQKAEQERGEFKAIAAEGRRAGRREAAEILLAQEAEAFPSKDLLFSYAIADTGEVGTGWERDAVLKLFDAEGDSALSSLLERLDGLYWEGQAQLAALDGLNALKGKLAAAEAREAVLRAALTKHHKWQLSQTEPDQHGIIGAEAYTDASLCDETLSALGISSPRAEALLKLAEAAGAIDVALTANPGESLATGMNRALDAHEALRAALAAYREARNG